MGSKACRIHVLLRNNASAQHAPHETASKQLALVPAIAGGSGSQPDTHNWGPSRGSHNKRGGGGYWGRNQLELRERKTHRNSTQSEAEQR